MGIPSVVIPVVENQIEISEILLKKVASIILDRLELSDSLLSSIYNIVNN